MPVSGSASGALTNAPCWKFWLPGTYGLLDRSHPDERTVFGSTVQVLPPSCEYAIADQFVVQRPGVSQVRTDITLAH
jgi:hypothetical protein